MRARASKSGAIQAATAAGRIANRAASVSVACPTSTVETIDASGPPSANRPPATPFCASGTSSAMIAIIGASSAFTAI